MLKKALLFWEEVPEETKCYLLDVTEDELEMLVSANGQYVNSTGEQAGVSRVSVWLEEHKPARAELPLVLEGPVTVVKCGFLLLSRGIPSTE